jgi:K(+)-stimulated pyrophosphate-energized sodium pump
VGLAGYLGMKIATASNGRTTAAAKQSLNRALRVAFEAGSVMGFSVVGLGLLYITLWFIILYTMGVGLQEIAQVLLTSAMGPARWRSLPVWVGGSSRSLPTWGWICRVRSRRASLKTIRAIPP